MNSSEDEIEIIFKGNFKNIYNLNYYTSFNLQKDSEELRILLKSFGWEDVYGEINLLILDENENEIRKAYQTVDGRFIIPMKYYFPEIPDKTVSQKSISRHFYFDTEGRVQSSIIKADLENKPLPIYASIHNETFNISEFKLISLDDYFSYEIEKTYVMDIKDPNDLEKLNNLWKFYNDLYNSNKLLAKFRYAGSKTVEKRWGIIIPHKERLILVMGKKSDLEYIGKEKLKDLFDIEQIEVEEVIKFEEFW